MTEQGTVWHRTLFISLSSLFELLFRISHFLIFTFRVLYSLFSGNNHICRDFLILDFYKLISSAGFLIVGLYKLISVADFLEILVLDLISIDDYLPLCVCMTGVV